MVEILKDNARPEAAAVYRALICLGRPSSAKSPRSTAGKARRGWSQYSPCCRVAMGTAHNGETAIERERKAYPPNPPADPCVRPCHGRHDPQVTIVMSDRGIPKSFRHMHGFGSHTFSMINAENKHTWVKFHFRSQQGIE